MNITENQLNDFLKQVLQKIMHNKTKHNLSGVTPSSSVTRRNSSPSNMPSKKRKSISPRMSKGNNNPKQLTLPLQTGKPTQTKYTDSRKWLQDNFDNNWTYLGIDLTGYPTGLLPDDAYTTGKVLDNEIYRVSILANPDVFMNDWNKAVKQKLEDKKKDQPPKYPPETGDSQEDINVNEIYSMIKEIVAEEISEVNYTKDTKGNSIIAQGAPGSVIRFATENPDLIKEMRDWIKDCSWADLPDEESIDGLSDEDVLKGIQRNYEGGIKEFIRNSNSSAEVPVGYKESLKEEFEQEHNYDDGYRNDHQRAFAHSQATTPRNNETEKAKQLAKSGKYVVLVNAPVFCKSTDACLGNDISIHNSYDSRQEASTEAEKIHTKSQGDYQVSVIGPEDLEQPKKSPESSDDNDVPFEGVGYVYDKDMKKDPKHIPGERWRVKFQEGTTRTYLKNAIKSVISEMWDSRNDVNGDETHDDLSVNEIISGYDTMIEMIKNLPTEEQAKLNAFVKSKKDISAYDAVLNYFEDLAKRNPEPQS